MNVVIIVLGKAKHTRDIKIWLWDFASLKFVWRAEKNLVASKGGSETESETCLYDSLGQICTSLKSFAFFIEGGLHTFFDFVLFFSFFFVVKPLNFKYGSPFFF